METTNIFSAIKQEALDPEVSESTVITNNEMECMLKSDDPGYSDQFEAILSHVKMEPIEKEDCLDNYNMLEEYVGVKDTEDWEKTKNENNYGIGLEEIGLIKGEEADLSINDEEGRSSQNSDQESQKSKLVVHTRPIKLTAHSCSECSYVTFKKSNLQTHLLRHQNPKEVVMYHCSQCDFKSKYKAALTRHVVRHKPIEMHKCNQCEYETRYKDNLKRHINTHEVLAQNCPYCTYKTFNQIFLERHIVRRHKSRSVLCMLQCCECDFQTSSKRDFLKHTITHEDTEIKMYNCDQCEFLTKRRFHLKNHIIKIHKGVSNLDIYKCLKCEYHGTRKCDLERHMLRKHKHKDAEVV